MIHVDGGTFDMGLSNEEQKGYYYEDEDYSLHNVNLGSYYIAETEVTEALWNAVMGKEGGSTLPITKVSWEDCQKFITLLNKHTGKRFRLPTEAEWEYAARGGKKSKGYHFSGSKKVDEVAWYNANSEGKVHPVKEKKANELGLYDMSGNVAEWCSDRTGRDGNYYAASPWVNPEGYGMYYVYRFGLLQTEFNIVRGGSFSHDTIICQSFYRDKEMPIAIYDNLGFRIALTDEKDADPQKKLNYPGTSIKVKNFSFKMIRVEGGTYTMGYSENDRKKDDLGYDESEMPAHQVTVNSFYIGETEVTQGLWTVVMGAGKDNFIADEYPAVGITWDECQEFIKRLNKLTGHIFRLPTEAEWEFAARGGKKSKGYLYAGSDNPVDAGWSWYNLTGGVQPVAQKKPNELGLYDMTGNVAEWCSDWYEENYYTHSLKVNPKGPKQGEYRICRGGYWNDDPRPVFTRGYQTPDLSRDEFIGNSIPYNGLRLVMVK